MPSHNTYHLTWVSLILEEVYLLTATASDLESGVAPLSPLAPTQLCSTLCDPIDSTVHGILHARILKWVAFPFSRGSSQPRDGTQVSCIAGGGFTI